LFDEILGSSYRLKVHRYYETYGGHHMHWHTDNKRDGVFAHIPGLIVLAYISDVDDGEFQFVRRSHNWSVEMGYNDYADQFVEQNCCKDILSFKGPRGTLIIYDSYGIHRAKPVKKSEFVRKSIVFQVDGALQASEPLLINPEYIDNLDDRMKRYLGFGQPAGLSLWPQTDLSTMPLSRQSDIFWYFVCRLGKKISRAPAKLLPLQIKSVIKGFLRHTSTL
jgi:ectoine hydroxylase-related dioxygenase (phytanoyl-CoA dioxygenase family)